MATLLKFRKDQKLKGNKYSLNAILMQSISNAFKHFQTQIVHIRIMVNLLLIKIIILVLPLTLSLA